MSGTVFLLNFAHKEFILGGSKKRRRKNNKHNLSCSDWNFMELFTSRGKVIHKRVLRKTTKVSLMAQFNIEESFTTSTMLNDFVQF